MFVHILRFNYKLYLETNILLIICPVLTGSGSEDKALSMIYHTLYKVYFLNLVKLIKEYD